MFWASHESALKHDTIFLHRRELKEECGLDVLEKDLDYVGIIDFEFVGDPVHLEVHVFLARKYEGQ